MVALETHIETKMIDVCWETTKTLQRHKEQITKVQQSEEKMEGVMNGIANDQHELVE